MNTPQRGFTLIELLVVISIIGLLASVLLASLSAARANANDAAVKSQVKEIGNQMEIAYSGSGYGPVFPHAQCPTTGTTIFNTDSKVQSLIAATGALTYNYVDCATGGNDSANASSWAVAAPFQVRNGADWHTTTSWWCADSSGTAKLSVIHRNWYQVAMAFIVQKAYASAGPPPTYYGPNIGGGTGTAAACP